MQLMKLLLTSFFVLSSAFALPEPAPRPQATSAPGAMCFDAGDCILTGGGMCNKTAGQLLGTCTPPAPGAAPNPIPGIPGLLAAAPSSTPSASRAGAGASGAGSRPSSAATASATGAVCFDAGDCILSGGGQCVKAAGQLTGQCSK